MKKTLKDLFIKKQDYILEIPVNKDYYLYIEGLDSFGCCIDNDFDIYDIEDLCIELCSTKDYEYVCDICSPNINLHTDINDIKNFVIKDIITIKRK